MSLADSVLLRSEEFINSGNRPQALQVLYEHVINNKAQLVHENSQEVMKRLVVLCLKEKKSRHLKDSLVQYRNICQNSHPEYVIEVFESFLKELKEMQKECEQEKKVEMEEEEEMSAEKAMLAALCGNVNSNNGNNSAVNAVKIVWEGYRVCVLDVIKNNVRFEELYEKAVMEAAEFCQRFKRKGEIRKLSDILRNHLHLANSKAGTFHSVNLGEEKSVERFLDILIEFELWQEALKTIEELQGLLSSNARESFYLERYYLMLGKLFEAHDNHLGEAICMSKLIMQGGKREEEIVDKFILSVICLREENSSNDNERIKFILGVNTIPTRDKLIVDIKKNGLLKHSSEAVSNLFNLFVVGINKMKEIDVCLKELRLSYKRYISFIHESFFRELVKFYRKVYNVLNLTKFVKDCLLKNSDCNEFDVEYWLQKENVVLDHSKNTIEWRSRLISRLDVAEIISIIRNIIQPKVEINLKKIKEEFSQEENEEPQMETFQTKQMKEMEMIEMENRKRRQEMEKRELEKLEKEKEIIEKQESIKYFKEQKNKLESVGIVLDKDVNVENFSRSEIENYLLKIQEKDQKETNEKMVKIGKRNDHLERAIRLEEKKFLLNNLNLENEKNKNYFIEKQKEKISSLKLKHEKDLNLKNKFSQINSIFSNYKSAIDEKRFEIYSKLKHENDLLKQKEIEKRELERKEFEKKEMERREIQRKEMEKRELERKEFERRESERREMERKEMEKREAEVKKPMAWRRSTATPSATLTSPVVATPVVASP
ncbi:hypothetical protein ROZALSC1DRAFT_30745, partial [Rozella allomycis CSF55]